MADISLVQSDMAKAFHSISSIIISPGFETSTLLGYCLRQATPRVVQNCLYNCTLPLSFLVAAQRQTRSSITLT